MDADKIRDRMQKLLALARRGEGGEKENAQRFLDKMLAKNGMTIADLDDAEEETRYVEIKYTGKMERKLLAYVIGTVLRTNSVSYCNLRGKMGLDLTRAQRMEIELMFSIYRVELKKSMDHMFLAFVSKNDLGAPHSDDDPPKKSSLPREDMMAIIGMMSGIEKAAIRPAIEK